MSTYTGNSTGGFEADDAPYRPAGTSDARLLVSWLVDNLGPLTIAQLAAKAISVFEAAQAGSDREATLGLLSDALHNEMVGE